MILYTHTNGIHILWAALMIGIVVLLVVGMICFAPLLKQTFRSLCPRRHSSTHGRSAQIGGVILTALLYGALILGAVFGIQNAVTAIQACVSTSDAYSVSGKIDHLQSDALEYRGDTLGYTLCLSMDGTEYWITDPPGIHAKSLELLKSAPEVIVHYQPKGDRNIIIKITTLA